MKSDLPIIILMARLTLMPRHIMRDAMTLLTSLTSKSRSARWMHLPRLATFVDAPAIIGNRIVHSFCSKFIVAGQDQFIAYVLIVDLARAEAYRRNTALGANSRMSSYCIRVAQMGQLISFQILVVNSDWIQVRKHRRQTLLSWVHCSVGSLSGKRWDVRVSVQMTHSLV